MGSFRKIEEYEVIAIRNYPPGNPDHIQREEMCLNARGRYLLHQISNYPGAPERFWLCKSAEAESWFKSSITQSATRASDRSDNVVQSSLQPKFRRRSQLTPR